MMNAFLIALSVKPLPRPLSTRRGEMCFAPGLGTAQGSLSCGEGGGRGLTKSRHLYVNDINRLMINDDEI